MSMKRRDKLYTLQTLTIIKRKLMMESLKRLFWWATSTPCSSIQFNGATDSWMTAGIKYLMMETIIYRLKVGAQMRLDYLNNLRKLLAIQDQVEAWWLTNLQVLYNFIGLKMGLYMGSMINFGAMALDGSAYSTMTTK